jgi:hypothetical protein
MYIWLISIMEAVEVTARLNFRRTSVSRCRKLNALPCNLRDIYIRYIFVVMFLTLLYNALQVTQYQNITKGVYNWNVSAI